MSRSAVKSLTMDLLILVSCTLSVLFHYVYSRKQLREHRFCDGNTSDGHVTHYFAAPVPPNATALVAQTRAANDHFEELSSTAGTIGLNPEPS